MRALAAFACLLTTACATSPQSIATYTPAPGSNEVLRGAIDAAPGHEMVVGDLLAGPDTVIPRHYHHGEEFLYVLGGSATVSRPGTGDVTLGPGESLRIPPGTVHWGLTGPEGVRAITSWVVPDGLPIRVAVPE